MMGDTVSETRHLELFILIKFTKLHREMNRKVTLQEEGIEL